MSLVAGYAHTCALTADARVYCWGLNSPGRSATAPPRAVSRSLVTF